VLCPRADAVTTSTTIGDRVNRDDSLFPLGSGPLYLGGDLCYRAAVLPWRLPSVELVRQSVSSIRIERRCYQIG
jgi:hypothetical protein